jgi:hypothetical protein
VQIIGKRIYKQPVFPFVEDPENPIKDYLVAFRLPDGSVKELQVGNSTKLRKTKREGVYDSLHEGDTGKLAFKEMENIENLYHHDEDKHLNWEGRLFISFEKDPCVK